MEPDKSICKGRPKKQTIGIQVCRAYEQSDTSMRSVCQRRKCCIPSLIFTITSGPKLFSNFSSLGARDIDASTAPRSVLRLRPPTPSSDSVLRLRTVRAVLSHPPNA
ncbi:hypothetical protein NEUTE1DRAFT_113272 [Neurospora tetrasperma FGSC 2508]|uniref:Uncharacterized protein n=1 Tax=Neurospora tetrasperma (strain FGSC 2508 / ATCC MYA-4615 / P0657) TaxID=510951 RepID=F8MVZ0_NEUT8|nr:uncharacterized protein NEUTE1DRAFT_113272 [Neurospora tetrasperma FGSC 2508]EGO54838.1 hypothetical protein NEUTE1DRAFT_113272 [Neurospora tetrasperma FGSC 2508]EGZ67673.1 hypothetical protein NEUTE2DRAFT_74687 [Neurospora tetrasperma FGSC 2509]